MKLISEETTLEEALKLVKKEIKRVLPDSFEFE